MQIALSRTTLPLVHPFTIARGSSDVRRTLLLRFDCDGVSGIGEASPNARYAETLDSVELIFAEYVPRALTPFDFETLLGGLPPAARCALDVALHDWVGKRLDVPLYEYLGIDARETPCTSFTIGIDTIETMLAKLEEIRDAKIIKVKLGSDRDIEIIEALRSRYTGTIRIDANEAWDPETAIAMLGEFERYDIEFCEQPIPAGTPERLRWIQERSAIPIVTDEDSCSIADILALRGCVAGVNIKLVKIGGIRAALEGIRVARSLGLKVMLGCMIESSVLATAAAHISPLVDWADIDAPFLIAEDPYRGVTYQDGQLILPRGPGLGVINTSGAFC